MALHLNMKLKKLDCLFKNLYVNQNYIRRGSCWNEELISSFCKKLSDNLL